jgi:hypothetical protein
VTPRATMRGARRACAVALGLIMASAMVGCTDEAEPQPGDPDFVRDPALDVANRSAPGERRSHNQGLNCMTCHQQFGPGRGRFTVGLTVHGPTGPIADPILELYDGPPGMGGAMVARLTGDALGNVFTTDDLGLPDRDLFPLVFSADRALTAQMPFPTISGACNTCHKPGFEVRVAPPRS